MKKYYIIVLLISVVGYLFSASPHVTNLSVTPETGRVKITYNLTADAECQIIVLVSADGGTNYDIYPSALTGHVGNSVLAGIGNEIIWRPGADNMEIGVNYRVKVIARDNPVDTSEQFESFVKVTGGSFNNGTADVTISDFYISKYEVTQAEYEAVMNTNPSTYSGSSKPVERVSWEDAVRYCNTRSLQEGLTPCYNTSNWSYDFTATGYRLPTEMEWMYASKGGNEEPASGYNQYAGTSDEEQLTNYAWYSVNNSPTGTKQVGIKLPNQLGLYDMSGNVWEWCNDKYGAYGIVAQTDPLGPLTGPGRVIRSGCWSTTATYCTVTRRSYNTQNIKRNDSGFRLARSIGEIILQEVADPTTLNRKLRKNTH